VSSLLGTVMLVVTYVSTFVPWAFILAYHLMTAGTWRRDPMGWHIMAITAVDAGIFSMLLGAVWWPMLAGQPVYQWTYVLMVAGIPAVTAWRGVILWRLYRERAVLAVRPPRRRLEHPLLVWQGVLALAQVVNAELVGGVAGGKLALLVGAAQVAVGFYAYGRAKSPATNGAS
jgi:hypothetical protein